MIARVKNKLMRIKSSLKVRFGLFKKSTTTLILSYHGVAPELSNPLNSRHIDPVVFEEQLIFINQYCNPVSLSDLNSSPKIKGKRKVVLTFDDGYHNNLKYALPLLEKHKIPASIYITGLNKTSQDILWSDYHDLIAQFGPKTFDIEGIKYNHNGSSYKPFVDEKSNNLHDILKTVDFDRKYEILNEIISWDELKLESNKEDYWKLLSDSEIQQLEHSNYIEIGSHSFYHNNLSQIERVEAFNEILNSKNYLESLLDKPLQSIAYPDGSYTRDIIEYSDQLGFEKQLAVNYLHTEDTKDKRILSRIGIYEYETLAMQKINILEK